MVLRCSLLGHNYGEPEVDREREERGSEVVLTVTEFQACQRCGERNVISENTEVTSIAPGETPPQGERAADDADGVADTVRSPPAEPAAEQPTDIGADSSSFEGAERDAGSVDAGTISEEPAASDRTPAEAASDVGADEIDVPTDENDEPIVDDGEILEDDGDDADRVSGDRRHGEWPDSEDVGPPVGSETEPSAWPDDEQESTQAVTDADDAGKRPAELEAQPEDDAVILESGPETEPAAGSSGKQFDYSVDANADSETSPGSNPSPETVSEASASRSEPAYETTAPEQSARPETGIASAESAPAPGEGSLPDGATTEFYCPQCAFVAPGETGSLRTGDICPECKKGYIGERTL